MAISSSCIFASNSVMGIAKVVPILYVLVVFNSARLEYLCGGRCETSSLGLSILLLFLGYLLLTEIAVRVDLTVRILIGIHNSQCTCSVGHD